MYRTPQRRTCQLALAVACASLSCWGASGDESTAATTPALAEQGAAGRVGLRRCLQLAERNFPKIREARAKREQKESLVSVAKLTPFSEFSFNGGLALAPTVTGTSEYSRSSDASLSRNMGLAWQLGIEGALPLYTFGKMTHAVEAAEAATRVGDGEVNKERNDLRLNVRKAYFGVLLARDARQLVRDALKQMDEQIAKLEKQVAEGEGDDIELLKLRVYRTDLNGKASEAEKQETVAFSALRFLTGGDSALQVPDVPLFVERHALEALPSYLERAKQHRPELAMAKAAIEARKSQVQFETSKYFPDLGLGLAAKWVSAPEVTDQRNPFVRDNGNFVQVGAGLVLKQKLDFLPQRAKVSQARAQVMEAIATEQWAKSGVAQQVTEAYAEVRDTSNKLGLYSEATQLAKQWLVKVKQGIEVGTLDDSDIVEPAKEYALKRYAEMLATYEYNIALAKLMQTTGTELAVTPDQ